MTTDSTDVRTASGAPAKGRLNREERRAQIVAAARDVFIEEGVHGARSRLIADRAGITEAYLYRHFASKDELFRLAIDEPLRSLIVKLENDIRWMAGRTDVPRTQILARCHELFLECVIEVAPLVAAALFSDPSSGRGLYLNVLKPQVQSVIEMILPDMTGWPEGAVDVELFSTGMVGVNVNVALESMLEKRTVDVPSVSAQIAEMFGAGASRPTKRTSKRSTRAASITPPELSWIARDGDTPHHKSSPRRRMPAGERRKKMIDSARAIFELNGLDGARTKDIAEGAGVTEAFLYRYFASKDELYRIAVLDTLETELTTLRDQITDTYRAERDPFAFMATATAQCLVYFQRYGALQGSATFGEGTNGPEFYKVTISPLLDEIGTMIAKRVGWSTAKTQFPIVRKALLGAMWMVGIDASLTDSDATPVQLARRLNVILTAGVRA